MDIESLKSKITDSLKRQQEASVSAIQLRKQAEQMEVIVSAFQGRIETLQELVREAGGAGPPGQAPLAGELEVAAAGPPAGGVA